MRNWRIEVWTDSSGATAARVVRRRALGGFTPVLDIDVDEISADEIRHGHFRGETLGDITGGARDKTQIGVASPYVTWRVAEECAEADCERSAFLNKLNRRRLQQQKAFMSRLSAAQVEAIAAARQLNEQRHLKNEEMRRAKAEAEREYWAALERKRRENEEHERRWREAEKKRRAAALQTTEEYRRRLLEAAKTPETWRDNWASFNEYIAAMEKRMGLA